ncbi:MAG: hypothetical protein KatS3mg102_0768 [Planctomycetota bacterium]|nr:MAG: hypothetical protein KatS3mg102_0768 [Planctomycetota bacterium]
MRRRSLVGSCLLGALLGGGPFVAPARGDVVRLANGAELRGQVLEQGPGEIVLAVPGGRLWLERGQVAGIEYEPPGQLALQEGEQLLRLGLAAQAAARFGEALAAGLSQARPRLGQALLAQAEAARAAGALARAERLLAAARVQVAQAGGALQLQVRAAEQALAGQRARARTLAGDGQRALVRVQLAQARRLLAEAVGLEAELGPVLRPYRAAAAARHGLELLAAGAAEPARRAFAEAIALEPAWRAELARPLAEAEVRLAMARLAAGQAQAARLGLLEALRGGEAAPELLSLYLGLLAEHGGEPLAAARAYRAAAAEAAALPAGVPLERLREAALLAGAPLPISAAAFEAALREAAGPGGRAPERRQDRAGRRFSAGGAAAAGPRPLRAGVVILFAPGGRCCSPAGGDPASARPRAAPAGPAGLPAVRARTGSRAPFVPSGSRASWRR